LYILLKKGNTLNNKVFKEDYMRKNSRISNSNNKSLSDKIIMYSGIGVVVLTLILLALLVYSKNLNDKVQNGTMSLEKMANITGNSTQNTESASTEIGKSVEESKNEMENNNTNNTTNNKTQNDTNTNESETNTQNTVNATNKTINTKTTNETNSTASNVENKNETKTIEKELSFQKPVEGEIVREYAKDNLVYSETLKEWVTHFGIDIKADKTTVVKAAEAGTVKSIKNDPRYGLTIVIEHDSNFQTVYSNLLTSEFVVEGEKVEKGQSIGTVGNTAVFEIVDEPHLHFEILKDSLQVDPNIYIK